MFPSNSEWTVFSSAACTMTPAKAPFPRRGDSKVAFCMAAVFSRAALLTSQVGWFFAMGPVLCIVGYLVTSWPLPSRYQKQLSSTFFTTSFPGGINGKEPHLPMQVRHKRCRFNPWVTKFPWRGKWQPTPIFLPGESHGQKGLAGCSWGSHIELDTTELT